MTNVTLGVTTASTAATEAVARSVGELLVAGDVVLLAGDLGAGKTMFARGIAAGLGITEPVVSPTFTIAREYQGRLHLVHLDVYRLDTVQELLDLGLDDLAGDDAVLVVEWGDIVDTHLASERLDVRLDLVDDDPESRRITVCPRGASWSGRAVALRAAVEANA